MISSADRPVARAAAETTLDVAIAFARTGDIVAARGLAETQLKEFPDAPGVLCRAGEVMRLCGDQTAALMLSRRADAVRQTKVADQHAARGEIDEALRWYRQAIGCCPDYAAAWLAAAKLERARGKSWDGLLLLEALYERMPYQVEGNTLRTEFLRYHAAHPEVARKFAPAIVGAPDDWTAHLRHLRALSRIGDFAGVLSHIAGLTLLPESELAFHAAVFSGHAKLALAVDNPRAVARAAAMERSSAWLDTERLTTKLRDAIRDRAPLSMIRLGDGEARFLAVQDKWAGGLISGHEAQCIASGIWRNWFGRPIEIVDPEDLATLSAMFTDALADADILGVSTADRYEKDTYHRGYLAILDHAVDDVLAARDDVALVHAFANVFLHRRSAFYGELLAGVDFLGCISPHPGLAARLARHHGIAGFAEYLVPGEARLRDVAKRGVTGVHFPDRFREIMSQLNVPRPGAIFLVAAGLLGKIYCHRVRQLGGIAIDAGSIVDAWMGFSTRPGLYHEPHSWVLPV